MYKPYVFPSTKQLKQYEGKFPSKCPSTYWDQAIRHNADPSVRNILYVLSVLTNKFQELSRNKNIIEKDNASQLQLYFP